MNYFGISSQKLSRYLIKYSKSPANGYFRLMILCGKMFLKEIWHGLFVKRHNNLRLSVVVNGGIGDILIGGLFAKYLNEMLKNTNVRMEIFTPLKESVARDLFYKTGIETLLYGLTSYKPLEYDVEIVLSLMIPRVTRYKKCSEINKWMDDYISELRKFEEENTCILSDDRQLNQLAWMLGSGYNRISALDVTKKLKIIDDLKLCVPPAGQAVFQRYPQLKTGSYITISRGVDQANQHKDSVRLWSVSKYEELIINLKKKYPEYLIVYLGASESSCKKIKGVDVNLVGKTSIPELMAVLNDAKVHFDMECGMVHMRHFLCRKPSIVLFGPTSPLLKGYPENINIRNDSACKLLMCEHILLEGKWTLKCLKTNSQRSECIESISVSQVINAFETIFSR